MLMKSSAFWMSYILCQTLVRGDDYVDAITDSRDDEYTGGEKEASAPEE